MVNSFMRYGNEFQWRPLTMIKFFYFGNGPSFWNGFVGVPSMLHDFRLNENELWAQVFIESVWQWKLCK